MSTKLPALSILYGSATGNSEHIAKDLSTSVPSKSDFYSSVICCEMNQFKRKCQKAWDASPGGPTDPSHPVVFVTSTTGNGDPPENAGRFVRYVKKADTAKSQPFKNCTFAVLALGDTNYDQFCSTGKLIDRKVFDCGGTRAKKIACADEGTGLEDVVEPWVETVMEDLRKACLGKFTKETNAEEKKDGEEEKEDVSDIASDTKTNISTTTKTSPNVPVATETSSSSVAPVDAVKLQSAGLEAISNIAKQNNILEPHKAPPSSSLPSLTTSMSSCTLIDKSNLAPKEESIENINSVEEERRSILSGSSLSAGCYFNLRNPYSATVLSARYLTNTSTSPLSKALLATSTTTNTTSDTFVKEISNAFDVSKNEKDAKRVIELNLDLPEDYSLEYEPGDSIGMLVSNDYTFAFQSVMSTLQQTNTTGADLTEQLIKVDENEPMTIHDAVAKTVDITSVVKKRILARLAQLCDDEQESNVLALLCSKTPQGEILYKQFVEKYVLNIGHILALFPSCKPTIQDILGICDGIVPRYYSITSSPLDVKDRLTIAFSVVDYCVEDLPSSHPMIPRRRGGLATQFLEIQCASFLCSSTTKKNPLQTTIPIFPKASDDFRLPKSLSTPLILVGPGTGVAPFLGFLSHRACLNKEKSEMEAEAEQGTWRGGFEIDQTQEDGNDDNEAMVDTTKNNGDATTAKSMLFFGCRWPDHDYLYKTELQEFLSNKTLSSLHSVFSRVPVNEGRKYVQHEMRAVGKEVVDLICQENASVYVCGDGNAMGKDVQDCLVSLLNEYGGDAVTRGIDTDTDADAGKLYMDTMKKKNKFVLDIWS